MALSTPLKALALVTFLVLIGGATYGVKLTLGDSVSGQLVQATPARDTLNGTAGHNVTYAITLVNRAQAAKDLSVSIVGDGIEGRSDAQSVPAQGNATFLVEVALPQDAASGERLLDVRVMEGDKVLRERADGLRLRVLEPGIGYERGDTAEVLYVGRLAATGRVFNTNDPVLAPLPFPKTDTYRASAGTLPIQPQPGLVEGFVEGLEGMQVGETRTVTFGPDKGYGGATTEETQKRDEVLERVFTLAVRNETVGREVFDDYIAETRQTSEDGFGPGDVFIFEQAPNRWPYRILSMNSTSVEYNVAVEAGQRYTLFPFWPNASEVASVNETAVLFRTTPTTEVGAPFTMRAYWPNMSAVRSVNETSIVVRHSPPAGFTYTITGSSLQQAREATVKALTEESIVTAIPASHPLAGQDLTFDITLLRLDKGA